MSDGHLMIRDTTVSECFDVGIRFNSESSGSLSEASIENSRILGNVGSNEFYGIGIYARKNVKVTVRDTVVAHNSGHGLMAGFERGVKATMVVENCAVTHNGGHGIFASDGSKIYVSHSTVSLNPYGYGFAGSDTGTVYSRWNNTVEENGLGPGAAVLFSSK